jgi:hypothetical protein
MAYNPYHDAKIYLITSPSRPDLIYYGSTIQSLEKRFIAHKCDAKKYNNSSKILINCGDAIIELVENYQCESKYELECRERLYIENNPCVNKKIPTRTEEEYYEENKEKIKEYYEQNKEKLLTQQKEYREQNKEKLRIRQNEYREQNKEKVRIRQKEYREQNKEKLLTQQKEYREQNKDKIHARQNERFICICGKSYVYSTKARHERSQYHIDYINTHSDT